MNISRHIMDVFVFSKNTSKSEQQFVNRLPIWTFRCNQIVEYGLESLLPGFIFLERIDEQLAVLKMNTFVSMKPV